MRLAAVGVPTLLMLAVGVAVRVAGADLPPSSAVGEHAINWADRAPQIAKQLYEFAGGAAGDENAAAAAEHLLRQGIAAESPWADQSPAEHTQQLQLHLGERGKRYRAQRRANQPRRMQASAQETDARVAAYLNDTGPVSCTDPVASNTGAAGGCAYDCQTLQNEFFPAGEESRCFIYDSAAATWPDELLNLRQRYIYVDTFLSSENPPDDGVSFNVGEGRQCRNVTVRTTLLGIDDTHTEVLCLVDGEHEYNHTVTGNHSVEVVGYAESGVHAGSGGTTPVVIGECTDLVLRVTTTVSGGPMTWSLDDGGHNGPWDFNVPGEIGVHELESCMFDNDYTLVRQDGTGWQGTVEMVGFIRFHNTIEIPNNENWIIQGGIDAATGLPASLDGRLSSGTPLSPSQSNIVLRDMRFSGQSAPIDPYPEWRQLSLFTVPNNALGGAFSYNGGGDDPSNLPRLVFERVIFDHNTAANGASVFIDSRAGLQDTANSSQTNWDSGISWTMRSCTFFRNHAAVGGSIFAVDVWPMQFVFEDVDYVHNLATFMQHEIYVYNSLIAPDRRRTGESWFQQKRCHFDGGWSEGIVGIIPSTMISYETSDDPEAMMNVTLEGTTVVDHTAALWSMFQMFGWWPPQPDLEVQWNLHVTDYNLAGNQMLTSGDTYDSAFFADFGHHSLVERSRFEDSGPVVPGSIGVGGWAIYRAKSALPWNRPTVRFVNTEFNRNTAANGAAVGIVDGVVDLFFDSCVFRGNTASRAGGAIAFDAGPSSKLWIERSIFESNVVSIPQSDEMTTPAVVTVNTGGLGEGSQDPYGAYHMPVWRIDNGPVFGVPWEMCEAAKQYSLDTVAQGFAETWPSDVECANVSYSTQQTYSQVELVANGEHTLWHGVVTQGAQIVSTWLKGSIEVSNSVGPVFPTFTDLRQEHLPDCNHGGTCGTVMYPEPADCSGTTCCCPFSVSMWSSTPFFISAGKGGAIDVRGPAHVKISDSEFRNNDAPNGASMCFTSAASVNLVETAIDETSNDFIEPVLLTSASIDRCSDSPCEVGNRCYFRDYSRWCEPCRDTEIGDGLICQACGAGTEPNQNQSTCVPCDRPNEYSDAGRCKLCGGLVAEDRKQCSECPSHQVPIPFVGGCQCEPGRYNVLDGKIICHQRNYDPDAWESSEYSVAREVFESATNDQLKCAPCPSCVDCTLQTDPPRIRAGFSMAEASVKSKDLDTPGRDKDVFQCRPESTIGIAIDYQVTAALAKGETISDSLVQCQGTQNGTIKCSEGHGGELCGECTTNFGRWHDNRCERCSNALQIQKVLRLFGLIFALAFLVGILVIAMSFYVGDVYTPATGSGGEVTFNNPLEDVESPNPRPNAKGSAQEDKRGQVSLKALFLTGKRLFVTGGHMALHPAKIFISYWQIVAQMGNVLHFQFPDLLDAMIRKMKWVVTGIQGIVATECIPGFNGYYASWRLEVFMVPGTLLGAVLLYYLSRRATVGPAAALATARNEAFFIIFICYPSITNKLFALINCRELDESSRVLSSDYSTVCDDDDHKFYVAIAYLMIGMISVGVPVGLMISMAKTRASEAALFNTPQWNVVIQRMAALLDQDDVDSVRSTVIDVTQGKIYGNLISAYKPGWFLWESIDMGRKLAIIGVLSQVSQGSTFQICVGILTTFVFFAGHVAILPYRHWEDNLFKATTELHLFCMMVLVLALKTDMASEKTYSVGFYDYSVFILWVILVPATFFLCVWSKFRSVIEDDIAEHEMNPNRMVQMAFKRCQLGRDKHEDREVLYEYIDAMSQGDTADLQEAGLYHQPNESLCPNDANICTDTLVCRGSYQSISDTVTCAVKIRPVESKTLVENLVRLECNHKNICGMINAIETSKSHYLILQLCVTSVRDAIDASKLSAMIGDRTPLQVCGELIEAIETLHSKKFIHGNVCPANVLLDESGTPKLCGFSSAVQLRDDGSCTMCTSRCTPGYLPPEILDSEETQNGTAVDAFGVGCTMFAILSGEELYQGESSKVINAKVAAGDSRLDTLVSLYTARNLIQGLVATDPLARPQVAWSRTHPLFWTKQQALQYLANVGGNLQVGIARNQDPFVAELEAAVDSFIGAYNEEDPSSGGSWAELLDSNYPIGGDWGKMQRAPEVDERNYHIFGNPPKKKQVEARERLLADGKPLGPHQAKEIRTVGLLKFARNLNAHKAENVETGRFESEEAIADYILSSLPWLLMTVHTLDAKYNEARMIEDADKPQSQEDKTLRMSFATNAMRSTDSAIWSSADESASR